jgi:hypothetical protein
MLVLMDTDSGLKEEFPSPPPPTVPISDKKSIPACHGVYFAYAKRNDGWECVYVGESKNMRNRLSHRPELGGVTLGFLRCEFHARKRLESLFIAALNPSLNSQSVSGGGRKGVSGDVLEMVMRATRENAATSKSGAAHYATTARLCHVRKNVVLAAWRQLDKALRIRRKGDFAYITDEAQARSRCIVGERYFEEVAMHNGDEPACPFD